MNKRAREVLLLAALGALLLMAVPAAFPNGPQDQVGAGQEAKADPSQKEAQPPKDAKAKVGLAVNDPKAFQGYTLFAPMMSTKTYLIDMQGKVVRTWESEATPALSAYLLPNGHLLRPGTLLGKDPFKGGGPGGKDGPGGKGAGPGGKDGPGGKGGGPGGPGAGGRIQEFTWEGELVWDYKFSNETQLQHHDICPLPNGNVLLIAWDKKTAQEATAAGRKAGGNLDPDCIVEIQPLGKTDGKIVWEWHVWDHLIQDHDKTKANYGNVASHPELIDLNYGAGFGAKLNQKDVDKLKGIGYFGGGAKFNADWTHFNCVAYNADFDQIMVSVHEFSEIWIIDHNTTTAEAAGHTGGKSGKGGDLLYRWGNPLAYRAGTAKDQRLFAQHNAHWIPKGLRGEGHLLVFNNGIRRPDGNYSSVDEVVLPVDGKGQYSRKEGAAFGPDEAFWSFTASKKTDFFSMLISGAQRLPNGDTLICSGMDGTVFEVTPDGDIVWKYVNPVKGGMGPGGFGPGGFGFPGGFDPKKGDKGGFDPKKGDQGGFDPKGKFQFDPKGAFQPAFGKGGIGGFGPAGSSLFRSSRYGPDYPGLKGRDLTPGRTIEEMDAKEAKKG